MSPQTGDSGFSSGSKHLITGHNSSDKTATQHPCVSAFQPSCMPHRSNVTACAQLQNYWNLRYIGYNVKNIFYTSAI